ncbi:hypothetical protein HanRHA438_Chr03g0106041 [Helianthus annuus]|nr:hypothetical protein HanIR_Chr03g0103691 [Helianthus annuus]KAJ0934317.1 hypothetical protein HanRHA438_Chr03g0106041 [Helianthus annuus]
MTWKVSRPTVYTTEVVVKYVGYKRVFYANYVKIKLSDIRKKQMVAQEFSQRPIIDYEKTYSLVVDALTFQYFISLVI